MLDPKVLVVLIVLSAGYYIGEKAVEGIKKVDVAIVHVLKKAGSAVKSGGRAIEHKLGMCDGNDCLFEKHGSAWPTVRQRAPILTNDERAEHCVVIGAALETSHVFELACEPLPGHLTFEDYCPYNWPTPVWADGSEGKRLVRCEAQR